MCWQGTACLVFSPPFQLTITLCFISSFAFSCCPVQSLQNTQFSTPCPLPLDRSCLFGFRMEHELGTLGQLSVQALELQGTVAPLSRTLTIIHFNDVYNIEGGKQEPVGGAARFATQVKQYQSANPLVLFSGDAFNPSLLSTITLGKQMVPVLNAVGVTVAAVGNHDLDYGVDNLTALVKECKFPWLMANVLDKNTGQPLGGVQSRLLLDWHGVRVGVVGLVEAEWLETLSQVEPEAIDYVDFVEEGRRAVEALKADGAELLIALTHMREPNDQRLAREVPELHIIAGGHDHHYEVAVTEPHGTLLLKSGTDFREFTVVQVTLGGAGEEPTFSFERVAVTSEVAEDPEVKEIVEEYVGLMGSRLGEVVGESATELEGRFSAVRTQESSLGNFLCDAWRADAGVDVVMLNSGSLRSDQLHPAGPLTLRDLVSILPMMDQTVVLECPGSVLLEALENGVSMYPKLEGRFLQVSGVHFKFDPRLPAGSRILPDSVLVGGAALQAERHYRIATKAYLAEGRDGFDCLQACNVLVSAEAGVLLPTLMRNHFRKLCIIGALNGPPGAPHTDPDALIAATAAHWRSRKRSRTAPNATSHSLHTALNTNSNPESPSLPALMPPDADEQAARSSLCMRNPATGRMAIAPRVEGRIVNVAEGL